MFEKYFYFQKHLLFADNDDDQDAGGPGDGEGKDDDEAGKDSGKGKSKESKTAMSDAIDDAANKIEAEMIAGRKGKKDDKADENDDKDDEKDDKDDKSENTDEDNDEDDDEEKEKELSEEELFHAKNLFKLLTNPKTAVSTLKTLASQANVELKEVETKKEEKVATKSIKDLVKDKLGKDYPFMSDKIAELLEELIPNAVKEQTKDLREKQELSENRAVLAEIKVAQEAVKSQYVDVPDKVLREVLRLQVEGEVAPGKKSSPEVYFKTCLIMAAENLKFNLVRKQSSSKLSENSRKKKDKSPLDSLEESRGSHKEGVKSTQVKSLNDAIEKAVETVTASMK